MNTDRLPDRLDTVMGVWAILTALVVLRTMAAVLPSLPGDGVAFSATTLLLLALLGATGLGLASQTNRWGLSVAGVLLVGWGMWSVHLRW